MSQQGFRGNQRFASPQLPACAGTGLNYAAILDTAADIAKAMLHLHTADILHGDLKVGACIFALRYMLSK